MMIKITDLQIFKDLLRNLLNTSEHCEKIQVSLKIRNLTSLYLLYSNNLYKLHVMRILDKKYIFHTIILYYNLQFTETTTLRNC